MLEVTWSGGRIADAWFDTFELRLGMPNTPGKTLWFPTVQRCVKGVHRWIEIPAEGEAGAGVAGTGRHARQEHLGRQ